MIAAHCLFIAAVRRYLFNLAMRCASGFFQYLFFEIARLFSGLLSAHCIARAM